MRDEQDLLAGLGVSTKEYIAQLTHFIGTGRLSVLWHVNTSSLDDAVRVAVIASPDDIVKLSRVEEWLEVQPDRCRQVCEEFAQKGIVPGESTAKRQFS